MNVLEENYLRSIILLDYITKKITAKFNKEKISKDEFALKYPAYIELNISLYHMVVFQARKLYEAKIYDGLSNDEWLKLKSFREEITHANQPKSQSLNIIGDVNRDLIPLFNKLSESIYKKYDLENNTDYNNFVEKYIKDLNDL